MNRKDSHLISLLQDFRLRPLPIFSSSGIAHAHPPRVTGSRMDWIAGPRSVAPFFTRFPGSGLRLGTSLPCGARLGRAGRKTVCLGTDLLASRPSLASTGAVPHAALSASGPPLRKPQQKLQRNDRKIDRTQYWAVGKGVKRPTLTIAVATIKTAPLDTTLSAHGGRNTDNNNYHLEVVIIVAFRTKYYCSIAGQCPSGRGRAALEVRHVLIPINNFVI
ncbi:hypothetical protein ACTJJ2_08180 [Pseudomonas sp. 22447]|uniref:hypothetical protein n=1 Tax=Pseudomonas sp. 22447 TaxID=3453919 RepID=UPI003F847F39